MGGVLRTSLCPFSLSLASHVSKETGRRSEPSSPTVGGQSHCNTFPAPLAASPDAHTDPRAQVSYQLGWLYWEASPGAQGGFLSRRRSEALTPGSRVHRGSGASGPHTDRRELMAV